MALENKLGITSSAELAHEEERISKKKALNSLKAVHWTSWSRGSLPLCKRSTRRCLSISTTLRGSFAR